MSVIISFNFLVKKQLSYPSWIPSIDVLANLFGAAVAVGSVPLLAACSVCRKRLDIAHLLFLG